MKKNVSKHPHDEKSEVYESNGKSVQFQLIFSEGQIESKNLSAYCASEGAAQHSSARAIRVAGAFAVLQRRLMQ